MPERGLGLRVDGLRVEAGGRVLLDLPALDLRAGGGLAVTGPSGSGKSTLLMALAGLAPAAGRVLWDGCDLLALPEAGRARWRRERLGLLFQDARLVEELDALQNAAVATGFSAAPERPAIRARAADWLGRLGLGDRLGADVRTLSGGERARVALARALARDPPAILADEPTASLDRAGAERLADALAGLVAEGRTLLCATHDEALAARLGARLALREGRADG